MSAVAGSKNDHSDERPMSDQVIGNGQDSLYEDWRGLRESLIARARDLINECEAFGMPGQFMFCWDDKTNVESPHGTCYAYLGRGSYFARLGLLEDVAFGLKSNEIHNSMDDTPEVAESDY
jgi:hypothetical protein